LKTSRTTITTTTVARVLTAFVVALSSSAPGDVAQADGQVFGLTPKVLAPGKTVVLPERTSSADITREDARIVPHKAKKTFWKGVKRSRGSRAKARRSGRVLNEEAKSEERTPREFRVFLFDTSSFPEKSSLFTLSLIEGYFSKHTHTHALVFVVRESLILSLSVSVFHLVASFSQK
jgi:hypothetical protein